MAEPDGEPHPSSPPVEAGPPLPEAPRFGERTIAETPAADRRAVYGRERTQFGGIKFGVAFFGWLTATGLTVLLSAISAALFTAFGFDAVDDSGFGVALASAIVLVVVLFVSYLAGGYVAGRMARFAGARQGLAVWIWGVVITGILVIVAAVAGPRFDVLTTVGILPQIRFDQSASLGTVITVVAVIVGTLLGGILGGIAGMRFHRRVDKAGWGS